MIKKFGRYFNSRTVRLTVRSDNIPPRVASAAGSVRTGKVRVHFSQPVDRVQAADAKNYTLSGGAKVHTAIVDPGELSVLLAVSGLKAGDFYSVTAKGIANAKNAAAVIKDGKGASASFQADALAPGLIATYYATPDHSGDPIQKIETSLDYNWGNGQADRALPSDNFSVRWTGILRPKATGEHTLHVRADDGVRIWIDKKLVLRAETYQPEEHTAKVTLTKDEVVPIVVEHFEQTGSALLRILWSHPEIPKSTIPPSSLWHDPALVASLPKPKPMPNQAGAPTVNRGQNLQHLLYASPVVSKSTKGRKLKIDLDIEGKKELYLVVSDADGRNDGDWADWIDPRCVGPAGVLNLAGRSRLTESTGWGRVHSNKNANNQPIKVAGKVYTLGVGTHAVSVIGYSIPSGYMQFQTEVALDDSGSGTVQFLIFDKKPTGNLSGHWKVKQ